MLVKDEYMRNALTKLDALALYLMQFIVSL